MKRLLIVIPLLFVGSLVAKPDEVKEEGPDYSTAERVERRHAVRIVESWQEDYVRAMTLEGDAQEALDRLSDEVASATLPYEDAETGRLKDEAVKAIDRAAHGNEQLHMSAGYEALDALADGYGVSR